MDDSLAIKTVVLLLSFAGCCLGTLYAPIIGVMGYVIHYHIWPEHQWWGQAVSSWNLRYAFTVGVFLVVGTMIRKHTLKTGFRAMWLQEWLMVLFLVIMIVSLLSRYPFDGASESFQAQALLVDKMAKVTVFCLLLSHIVTTTARVRMLLWTMVAGTYYLGFRAWYAPVYRFVEARLNGVGGPDFRESSFLGSHFAIMLPIIGILFMSSGKRGKIAALITGVLAVNGLILTQTRAAFLAALVGAICAVLFALRGTRKRLIVALVPGLVASVYLMDPAFKERMMTILPAPKHEAPEDLYVDLSSVGVGPNVVRREADFNASVRMQAWRTAATMFLQNPFGVGVGNFSREVGRYDADLNRRDAHSTYMRCLAELGIPGVLVMGAMVLNAFVCLRRANRLAASTPRFRDIQWLTYGLGVTIAVMLTCGVFMSQTYVEEFWWFLLLPVCLQRAAEHEAVSVLASRPKDCVTASMPTIEPQPMHTSLPWRAPSFLRPPVRIPALT